MLQTLSVASPGQTLSPAIIRQHLYDAFEKRFSRQKVLVLIPDHTRSMPLPFFFRTLVEVLHDVKKIDFMIALGTHPPLNKASRLALVGVVSEEYDSRYKQISLLNHNWNDPSALISLGYLLQDQIKEISGDYWHPSLPNQIEICINKAALEYDHLLILGPTFPHEVVGFSGGAKYIFQGISGPEMIDATHWLGALNGVTGTIGIKNTPVRNMIHTAAGKLPTPVTLIALVIEGQEVSGMFIGDHLSAWDAAADLSARRHIHWCNRQFQQVLSCALPMYDELWTAAKAVYKLESVVSEGGELIIYAPHLDEVSHTHGNYIYEIGYHILPYFLEDWERFCHIPLRVLAHSTHVRGSGVIDNGVEMPDIKLTLASRISPQDCARLGLGYLNPADINISEWQGREDEGILYVPKAGEILYKYRP
jgi:nickel-dependent lactate racemase